MKQNLSTLMLVPVLFLAACATIGNRSSDLEVTIEHISAPQIQVFESRATVRIRIDNETAEPITLAGGVHHVRINGRRIGKAMDDGNISIPPFSSVIRELPITVSNLGVIRTSRESFDNKEVSYRLDSRVSVETASGKRMRSLRREGEVALDELMPTRPPANDLTPTPITTTPIEPAAP